VKVEYINVTDSNKPYSYVLNGCPAVQCPLDVFTSIYQPRFPASADVECTKKPPPTPPSKFIFLMNQIYFLISGDEGNKKLTVILILVGVVLGIGILVIFGCLYLRKTEHHSPLLSAESYTEVA
jgi:hypothetical protein